MDSALGFIGSFELAVEDKGRLLLPKEFRPLVGRALVLMCRPERAVAAYPTEVFHRLMQQAGYPNITSDVPALRRMLGSATEVPIEASYRITIPQFLRRYSGLHETRDALLIGTGDSFEIWAVQRYLAYSDVEITEAKLGSRSLFPTTGVPS